MVNSIITYTPSMHSQPPKSLPRFYRDVPLVRGTFETSLGELLVNVYLFLSFTIVSSTPLGNFPTAFSPR